MNLWAKLSEEYVLGAMMLSEGVPDGAVRFFMRIYPQFASQASCTCSEMARFYGCTPQMAARYAGVLADKHYFSRLGRFSWQVNRGILDELLSKGEPHAATH